jgi:hypothetical protein
VRSDGIKFCINNFNDLVNDLENVIIHILNIIRWTQLNPRANIFFWHDSTPEIVENTRRLIDELLSNEELILLIEIVDKIIRYDGNLHYNSILYDDDYYDEYEKKKHELKLIEIDKIICDELTTKFLRYKIKYKSDDPSKIDKITDIEFTEQFRQLVGRISELITFDETTGFIRIVPGTHTSITLLNLHFRSILELERLQQLEYTGKYLIQYFGLNLDNSIIGRYFSTKTTKLTKVSASSKQEAIVNHKFEIVIVVDVSSHDVEILKPLFKTHQPVILTTALRVVCLKCVQKVIGNIVFCFLSK